jgi:hypothetical protein
MLFFAGGMIAISIEMLGAPALIFALGMYLPLELNTPALVGGFIAHLVTRKSERVGNERGRTMRERGVIIASGLMAGGALGGVFGAALRLIPSFKESWVHLPFYDNDANSQLVSCAAFIALCLYLWFDSTRKVKAAE